MQTEGMNKPASTAKIAIWYTIGNIFASGLAMLTTPLFARLMSKQEYGQFANFTSWESIIVVLVTLNLSATVVRAKFDFDERMDTFISSILAASNVITLVAWAIIECNRTFFTQYLSMDIAYIRMLLAYLLFLPAFSYLQIKHRAYQKYKFFVFLSISSALIRTGTSAVLVYYMQDKLFARTVGYIVPMVVISALIWIHVYLRGKRIAWDCITYAVKISIPLIPHALAGNILGNSDRIMITNICGSEFAALYSMAYTIGSFASLLWTSMNQAWVPWLYDRISENKKSEIKKASKMYVLIYLFLIVGILLAAPEILLIFGGRSYYEAKDIIPPLLMGCAFQLIYGTYVNLEIYAKKTALISVGTVGAAAVNVILNLIFIPRYGYLAAAYTTMAGYFLLFLFHYIIVKVVIREYADIYDTKFIWTMIMVISLLGIFGYYLYQYPVWRYPILTCYIIVVIVGLIKKRKAIFKLIMR